MSEAAASSGFGLGAGIARALSDDRLAQRAVKGDDQAFAAIFRRYHQGLYRFCLAILGNPLDAQDALQNTMVKVLRSLPGEERRIELKPWLFRIAHNESIELLRHRHETQQIDAGLAALGPGLAEEAAARERLRRLISDLDELPERQRGALVMRELAGLDFAEIGAALGASPGGARQALYEARLSLRQMDQGRGMRCGAVSKALSDGDVRVARRRDVRAHLRACASCRRFHDEIDARKRDLAALSPLPAAAAAGMLNGLLGGGGAGGSGLAAALGGGAANSIGTVGVFKGAALVAVAGAIAISMPGRGGLIHLGSSSGEGGSPATQAQRSADGGRAQGRPPRAVGAAGVPPRAGAAAVGGADRAGRAAGIGQDARADVSAPQTAAAGNAASPDAGTRGPEEANTNVAADGTKRNVAPDETTTGLAPDETTTGAAGAASTTQGAANGKGHTKELPSASDHGQQTAAAHKDAEHGPAGGQSEAENPSHPAHPAHPSNPGAENGPPGAAVHEEHSQAPVAPPVPPAAEASPAHGHGKGKQP